MYNFDSLTLKYFYFENYDFIKDAILQKIQLPTRYEVILNLRNINSGKNKKLYININPKYPHICFLDEISSKKRNIKIPSSPPMFCMQLRKYLSGSKIKDFKIVEYERILEFYFDYFDEIGSLTRLCLACEFMGKHSNIILYNAQNKTIIGSIHNVSIDKSSIREIYGGIKYIYPPQIKKSDILKTSYSNFFEIAKNKDIKEISANFYYFSQPILKEIFEKEDNLENIFEKLQKLQNIEEKTFLCSFWYKNSKSINGAIDSYFSDIMFEEILKNQKSKLKKYLTNDIKKLKKTLFLKPDSSKAEKHKLCADLIMANLYNIKQGQKEFILDDLKIELDENLSIQANAQKYYASYKKAKTALEYDLEREKEAKEKLQYFDEIIFNIENSSNFEELEEIKDELIDLDLIKNEKKEKTNIKITPLNYKGWEIYIGKNSRQNDYLISKIARGEDFWFHGLNFPSSHVILKVPNDKKEPEAEILEFCAKLTKENSKAKASGKTSIIMTKRKNLKKPPNTYPGYVTYKNEIEIVI